MNASIKQNEQFILYSNDDLTWNHQHEYCNLPEWMHGEFEYLSITHEQLIFRDPVSFKTYTMKCLELFKDTKNRDQHEETTARVLTLSRTQCGKYWAFSVHMCVYFWIYFNVPNLNQKKKQVKSSTNAYGSEREVIILWNFKSVPKPYIQKHSLINQLIPIYMTALKAFVMINILIKHIGRHKADLMTVTKYLRVQLMVNLSAIYPMLKDYVQRCGRIVNDRI